MKLYYAPDTCSRSPHIVLRELALGFELVKVITGASSPQTAATFALSTPRAILLHWNWTTGRY